MLVSSKPTNFARQNQHIMRKITQTKTAHYFIVLATILFSRLLAPTSAYAQIDTKYPDQNDKLAIPFEITTVKDGEFAGDTHWYSIHVGTGKYWHTKEGSDEVFCSAGTVDEQSDEFLWCFTGDNTSGFRFYNKAKGAAQIAFAANDVSHAAVTMTPINGTMNPRTFKISANGDGYSLYYPTNATACINDLRGNGILGLWTSGGSPTDTGSRMTFSLISGDTDIPSNEGLPFKPTKILEDGSLASNTHWYTMTIRGDKNIYAEKNYLRCEPVNEVLESQLWAFVGNKESGFEIYNYETGTTLRAYTAKGSSESEITMENKSSAVGTYFWMLSDNNNGGYNFHYPRNPTSCWNDFNNENWVGIWRDVASPNDLGSNIVFTEQSINSVGRFVYLTEIKINKPRISLFPGETGKIDYTLEPADASNKALWFYSMDHSVCTVDQSTGELTAVAPGETEIIIYSMDGSNCYAFCTVTVKDGSTLLAVEGPVVYVHKADGGVEAFPEAYLSSYEEAGGKLQITAKDGTAYTYNADEYKTFGAEAPTDFGQITAFKFNNKYNPDIVEDAFGTIVNDSLIQLTVAGIGKWLTPSFQISETPDAKVYVLDKEQTTKVSRNSFKEDVIYTVSREGCRMLRTTADGKFMMLPFGHDYHVQVDFLTDHPTGEYNVPAIYLTTEDGQLISSKTSYKAGTIRIDGGGVFPDLAEMPMQIKGRGNSSWAGTYGKSPYHFKFDAKTSVLGLSKGKHWNLIANAQHMSLMTNAIGMKIARMVGTQAPNDEIPVELYINGEYRGSYNLTQKVGFGNNSLDVKDTLVNAVLLELDSYYDEPLKFRTATTFYSLPVNIKEPESFTEDFVEINMNDIKQRFINGFLRSLKAKTGVEGHANVRSMATFLMTNELVCNYELMHPKSTFYFCRDILNPDSLFHFGPVWDLDWSYGYEESSTYFQMDPTEDFWTGANHMEAPSYIYDLRYNSGEAFEREYFRVWTDFIQNHLQELLDFCDEYQQYAQPSFDHNGNRWYESSYYDDQMKEAKKWLSDRANHIYDHLANTLGYAEKYPDVVKDPTPILDIVEDKTPQLATAPHIYTLDGRMVNAKGRLPRGIYIIRGRKVAIQ